MDAIHWISKSLKTMFSNKVFHMNFKYETFESYKNKC